jgi:hypothetical protein
MNLKKLTALLFAGVTAATPLVTSAQNPTILQGNYISNVFGQANFVLNPNAQTNVANVTLTNATATRSTTTPLVATSEWNVTVTSANGTAAWATRSFDAGMKNQNCEARFSYRGFQATSKAQIKQGANVVAELTLTPSATDPRIASINFPCGDLSAATTFVITDSATLSGTNEIGGIYVGLATNQANVAQAETVVLAEGGTAQSITGSTYTTVIFGTETKDSYGEYNNTTGIFTAKRAGDYLISSTVQYGAYVSCSIGTNNALLISKNDDVTGIAGIQTDVFTQSTSSTGRNIQASGVLSLAVGDTVRIKVYPCTNATLSTLPFFRHLKISRFPSSSELVVTPETQNVWGGVVYTSGNQALWIGNSVPTGFAPYNNAQWNQPTKLKGKAQVTTTNSGNDLGFSIPNLPVGNYKFDISGLLNSGNNSDTGVVAATVCNFKLIETTTSTDVARQSHTDQSYSSSISDETRDYINSFTGVFNNTSVATRNFRIEAEKIVDQNALSGQCQAYASEGVSNQKTDIAIIMTPIDNASNSALYVQGPVKASGTGAALSSQDVGYAIPTVSSALSSQSNSVYRTGTGISIPPGIWLIDVTCNVGAIAPTKYECAIATAVNGIGVQDSRGMQTAINFLDQGNTTQAGKIVTKGYFVVSSTTTYYPVIYAFTPTGSSYDFSYSISAIRIN